MSSDLERAAGLVKSATAQMDVDPLERYQMIWTTALMLRSEPHLSGRANMGEAFEYLHGNPRDFLVLIWDLNEAILIFNQQIRRPESDVPYKFVPEVGKALSPSPLALPRIFSNEGVMRCIPPYSEAFDLALQREAQYMENAEKGQREGPTYIEGHLRGKSPHSRAAAILMHGYDFWVSELDEYRGKIQFEDTINPLCEVLATHMRDSSLFRLLYDPEDLNWFEKGYGLTDEFIDYTNQLVEADSKDTQN